MKRARSSGFTLLELLVVVIVVGILATVALPQFGRMIRRSRAAEAENLIGAILTAELVYYQEHTAFTGTLGSLLIDVVTQTPSYTGFNTITTVDGTPDTAHITATGQASAANLVITGTIESTGKRTFRRTDNGVPF